MTTKAQVNVVMSDKALVKHLQKELARLESELRTPGPASSTFDYAALLRKKDLQIEKVWIFLSEFVKKCQFVALQVHSQHGRVNNTLFIGLCRWRRKFET